MSLAEPAATPYDLRWRMFGIHVRVHPLFWLLSVLLGYNAYFAPRGGGVGILAIWVACVFFSVLLHELGHVLMGLAFGSHGYIVLYAMGGLAIGSRDEHQRRWQRIAVLLAGPLIQLLLLCFLCGFVLWRYPEVNQPPGWLGWLRFLYEQRMTPLAMLIEINLFWPLLNLLPIWPLDGGQITREVCEGILGYRGAVVSLWISLLVAGSLAIHILMAAYGKSLLPPSIDYLPRDIFLALFFAYFAVGSFQALQIENSRRRWDDDEWWHR